MDGANRSSKMEPSIKAIGLMTYRMARAYLSSLMVGDMRASSKTSAATGLANMYQAMGTKYTKENSKTISSMDSEQKLSKVLIPTQAASSIRPKMESVL